RRPRSPGLHGSVARSRSRKGRRAVCAASIDSGTEPITWRDGSAAPLLASAAEAPALARAAAGDLLGSPRLLARAGPSGRDARSPDVVVEVEDVRLVAPIGPDAIEPITRCAPIRWEQWRATGTCRPTTGGSARTTRARTAARTSWSRSR